MDMDPIDGDATIFAHRESATPLAPKHSPPRWVPSPKRTARKGARANDTEMGHFCVIDRLAAREPTEPAETPDQTTPTHTRANAWEACR